jgi:hypothetical protein
MTSILRTAPRRRTLAVAAAIVALAPAGVALAGPDTNIQKPGHNSLTLDDPDTTIQKPGHRSLALDDPDTNIQKPGHVAISRPLGDV